MANANDCLLNKLRRNQINQQLDKEIQSVDRNVSEQFEQLFGDDLQKTISEIRSNKKIFNKGNNFEHKKVETILKIPEGSIQRVQKPAKESKFQIPPEILKPPAVVRKVIKEIFFLSDFNSGEISVNAFKKEMKHFRGGQLKNFCHNW